MVLMVVVVLLPGRPLRLDRVGGSSTVTAARGVGFRETLVEFRQRGGRAPRRKDVIMKRPTLKEEGLHERTQEMPVVERSVLCTAALVQSSLNGHAGDCNAVNPWYLPICVLGLTILESSPPPRSPVSVPLASRGELERPRARPYSSSSNHTGRLLAAARQS